jgi:hypothetical protein
MPGVAHFPPYSLLVGGVIAEAEMFTFFKVSRDPSGICICMGLIKAVYRLLQKLVIGNYNLQSSTCNTPFKECLTPFGNCPNGKIIRKRRSGSPLE